MDFVVQELSEGIVEGQLQLEALMKQPGLLSPLFASSQCVPCGHF